MEQRSQEKSLCQCLLGIMLIGATLVFGGLARSGYAQNVPLARYQLDQWTTEDGLPTHTVDHIVQADDGYLWMATTGGLVRFDGYRFTVYDAENGNLPSSRITALHFSTPDTLWVGTEEGYVGTFVDGHFTHYSNLGARLDALALDRENRVWAASFDNLVRIESDTAMAEEKALVVWSEMATDGRGDVWTMLASRGTARLQDDQFKSVGGTSRLKHSLIRYPSKDEILRLRDRGADVDVVDAEGMVLSTFAVPPDTMPWHMVLDRTGRFWAGGRNRVLTYERGRRQPISELFLEPATKIIHLTEDRAGTIWIGTDSDGLFRIKANPFLVYGHAQGLKEDQVLSIGETGDGIYLMMTGANRYKVRGEEAVFDEEWACCAVLQDRQGTRWLFDHESITARRGSEVRTYPIPDMTLRQIYEDPQEQGVFWLATGLQSRILRFTPDAEEKLAGVFVLGEAEQRLANFIHRDREGVLWVAMSHGLYQYDEDRDVLAPYMASGALPADHVRTIHEDDDGVLWFGTYGGGLVRLKDGQFGVVDAADGLSENVVSTLLEDEAGHFWMSGNQGVHRVRRAELNAFLDGEIDRVVGINYGTEAGLINPEASGWPALKASDGRMWFPTFEGAAVVDPAAALALTADPPLVHVEQVRVGTAPLALAGGATLAPNQRRFEIDYTAISLRDPEGIRYRYRLDGFDDAWNEAGTARSATYTNVPPGAYMFRVQAMNAGGVWSVEDGVLALTVQPYFYETAWFYLLCVLGLAGLGYSAYRYRVRIYEQREQALNRRVQRRTRDLSDALATVAAQAEELKSLDTAKSRFFANVSHEFRTPLTLIVGPLEDLQDGEYGALGEDAREQVGGAIENSRRLLHLVNQLLDVARLEAGRLMLNVGAVEAAALIQHIAQPFTAMAARKRIDYQVAVPDAPVAVFLDAERIEKVVGNLLGNAFKFTPEGGGITLTVATQDDPAHDGWLVVKVDDTGPGIAEEHLPHLFERFYQVDASSTRQQSGTGIGLALAHELVALHHGTIDVKSEVGRGTTFTVRLRLGEAHFSGAERSGDTPKPFSLPLAPLDLSALAGEIVVSQDALPSGGAGQEGAAPEGEDVTTVLVVDDNAQVRAYVRRHLAQRYRVLEAADGEQALALAAEAVPDLIVSDVMMPRMDGFALCEAVKTHPELDFIPVILLTAKASQGSKIEGLETGADAYMTKPFNVRELEVRVDNLIASRRQLQARYSQAAAPFSFVPAVAEVSAADQEFLEAVRTVIVEHLADEDFGVKELASAVGQSRASLYRRFETLLEESPVDLIWQMRLVEASHRLAAGAGTVSEVAYSVGFKSVSHFCKRFKDQSGMTPQSYVEQTGASG